MTTASSPQRIFTESARTFAITSFQQAMPHNTVLREIQSSTFFLGGTTTTQSSATYLGMPAPYTRVTNSVKRQLYELSDFSSKCFSSKCRHNDGQSGHTGCGVTVMWVR